MYLDDCRNPELFGQATSSCERRTLAHAQPDSKPSYHKVVSIARDPTVLDVSSGAATPPESGDAVVEGQAAGEYVVDRRLGGGAMGDVYAGRHPVIGKKVAIKVLKRELAGRAESAERFLREARAVNQIDHPNVVDVFALGRLADGRLYLVMDLLDGESLRARVARGPIAPDVALSILGQIAAALDAAHGRGVIHRDLKPDNIMLTGPAERPTAHVLDFGIAKLVADAAGERVLETLTGQGAWLGTPAYMAPEQWSADGATAASDRYALGIVAFELLTGKPPFAATTLPGMMEQHFRAAVPSVTSTGAALRPALDRAFARALAKEPGDRPATAAEVVAALEAAMGGKREITAPSRGGARWLAGAAGVAVVVAGAAIVVGGQGRERAPDQERKPVDPGPTPPPAAAGKVTILSVPPGARVLRGGDQLGVTPVDIDVRPGERVSVKLSKPGYAAITLDVSDTPAVASAPLVEVRGFEGVWVMPDGKLRQFERRGEQVAGFTLGAAEGPREFLRMFEFAPSDDGGVVFVASEPFIDERAPHEPSCHIPLRAEYHYVPADDSLRLRKEKAQWSLTNGHCVLKATAWSDARALDRVAGATADAVWGESRAGGGKPVSKASDDRPQQKIPPDRKKPLKVEPPPPPQQPAPPPPQNNVNPINLDDAPEQQLQHQSQQAPLKK